MQGGSGGGCQAVPPLALSLGMERAHCDAGPTRSAATCPFAAISSSSYTSSDTESACWAANLGAIQPTAYQHTGGQGSTGQRAYLVGVHGCPARASRAVECSPVGGGSGQIPGPHLLRRLRMHQGGQCLGCWHPQLQRAARAVGAVRWGSALGALWLGGPETTCVHASLNRGAGGALGTAIRDEGSAGQLYYADNTAGTHLQRCCCWQQPARSAACNACLASWLLAAAAPWQTLAPRRTAAWAGPGLPQQPWGHSPCPQLLPSSMQETRRQLGS